MSAPTVYINGQFLHRTHASLSVDERGVHFADGVYEVVRYFNGKAFTMPEHLERLKRSLAGIELACDADAVAAISDELVVRNGLAEARVYWQITRGSGLRNHVIADDLVPTVYLSAEPAAPLGEAPSLPEIGVITVPDDRWHNCWIKSLMLLPNSLAKTKAARAGASEALFIRDGRVTEGASTNCFAVFDGVLHTHPADRFILEGITRNVVIELAREHNIPVREEAFSDASLAEADELMITGTGSLLAAVTRVDEKPIGNGRVGSITQQLWRAFIDRVRRDCGSPA
jgi:D-alanine transaminase